MYYWINILDDNEGPEVAALRGAMFFTTRYSGDGEIIACVNDRLYVEVLSLMIEEPK